MPHTRSGEFWDERYRTGQTPWDYRGVPPEFSEYLEQRPNLGKLLIPGCGRGHEVGAALQAGIEAWGIDLSAEAIQQAKMLLRASADNVFNGDFFSYPFFGDKFDAIYERTFLCAIPPARRPDYVRRMDSLMKPGGVLFGFFLYGEEADPPPYPLRDGEEQDLFEPIFERLESQPSRAPLALFGDRERWQIWRKRPRSKPNSP